MRYITFYNTPVGWLELTADETHLKSLYFVKVKGKPTTSNTILATTILQLDEYFKLQRQTFDLPISPEGTDFQKRVWKELLNIPYGNTTSYQKLSEQLGDVKAIRAVGTANGRNPISIIIPCHRVIGSDGSLTGYAGGLENKRLLLEMEGAIAQQSLF